MTDMTPPERAFYAKVIDAFGTWLAKVRDAVMAAWHRFRARPDPDAVYTTIPLWTTLVDKLEAQLREIGIQEGGKLVDVPDGSFLDKQLTGSRNFFAGIPDEVHALIVQEIADAVAAGKNPQAVADAVDNLLDVHGSDRWINRARVIATTEVHRMANAGAQSAATTLQSLSSEPLFKRWDSRDDDRVRPDHMAADGQMVPVGSTFTVGDFPMLYPGDPLAPAEQVVNCRCSMSFHKQGAAV